MILIAVLLIILIGCVVYLILVGRPEPMRKPASADEFRDDLNYVAGEIKKLYEERAQILAENDRLKRDLEELRKKLGPSEPPRT